MTLDVVRKVAIAHGVISWVAALALLAVTLRLFLRRPNARRLFAQAAATTALACLSFASGALLEAPFRTHLRQRLFLASRSLGWLFERKLHLAFGSLLFALCALAALLAASRAERASAPLDPIAASLARAARFAYAASALFALFACVASSLAAARMRF
ncbi:hypothetical protein [Polyangium aurulentum]|uniref:hypothetical protein n=1 Tax=Polyangium aurulentum TaxID=2567896 RepID=UPI0010AE77B1|nr:hypothetical protein [Polyangium aurulentum]UQA61998.1 hypothetical protein E8A73_016595 [Polyangium aurulentum]